MTAEATAAGARDPGVDRRPRPVPTRANAFYWDAAAAGRLLLQRCGRCRRFQYPPDVACVHCQSEHLVPTGVSGKGTVYSYAVVNRPFHVGFSGLLPYVVGLVELDEQPGLRMLTNIVGVAPDRVSVGMAVEVGFEHRDGITLPQFRPSGGTS